MVLEGGQEGDKPLSVRGGERNDNENAEVAKDGDIIVQYEETFSPKLPLDVGTWLHEHIVDVDGARARNGTKWYESTFKESDIRLPKGKLLVTLADDAGTDYHSEITTFERITGCGWPLGMLRRKPREPFLGKFRNEGFLGHLKRDSNLDTCITIHDYLNFVGRLHKMSTDSILQRIRDLSGSLELPHELSRIGDLSWGEQRRVRLAATVIYSPSLLVLIEPTLDQDASSRQRIWSLLRTLSRDEGVTVLIRTKFYAEAARADIVLFAHRGKILAQDSPDGLLREFQCGTLEEVFRKLKGRQRATIVRKSESRKAVGGESHQTALETGIKKAPFSEAPHQMKLASPAEVALRGSNRSTEQLEILSESWRRIRLLVVYQWILFKRQRYQPVLALWFCLIACSSIFLASETRCSERIAVVKWGGITTFVESFLDSFPKSRILLQPYGHLFDALDNMQLGETSAVMEIGRNFPTPPQYRLNGSFGGSCNQTSPRFTLNINLDTINHETRLAFLETIFSDVILEFQRIILEQKNASHVLIDLDIDDPVFGSRFISRIELLAPKVVIHASFLLSMLYVAISLGAERDYIPSFSDEKRSELAASLLLSIVLFSAAKTAFLFVCVLISHWCCLLPLKGSLTLVILLILWQSYLGYLVGVMVSVPSFIFRGQNAETRLVSWNLLNSSVRLSAFLFVPVALLPRCMAPDILRSLQGYLVPMTPVESLFSVMSRGLGCENDSVWIGFFPTWQWAAFFPLVIASYLLCSLLLSVKLMYAVVLTYTKKWLRDCDPFVRKMSELWCREPQTKSTVPEERDRFPC